jgi:hypothetical protein
VKKPNRQTWKGKLYEHYFDKAAQDQNPEENQLLHSQLMRKLILQDFLYLPSSVWPYTPGENYPDEQADKKDQTLSNNSEKGGDLYAKQKGGTEQTRLSVFEGRLAKNLVQLYSNPGDKVLDPFAGRAARLQACLELNRYYTGFDTSLEAANYCEKIRDQHKHQLFPSETATQSQTWNDTSLNQRNYLEKETQDLVLTCPPYGWSEYYGNNGNGLEGNTTYTDFVEGLAACLLLSAESLKPDRYLVVVIRGWFSHKHYYDVAAHLERYLAAGNLTYHAHDVHKMSTTRERFHSDVVAWRRSAQTHEDILVWQKTTPKKTTTNPYNKRTLTANTKRQQQQTQLKQKRQQELNRLLGGEQQTQNCKPIVKVDTP